MAAGLNASAPASSVPRFVRRECLAELLGVNQSTISRMVAKGLPPTAVRGAYDLRACVQWCLVEAGHGGGKSADKARIDLARAQTVKVLAETEQKRGELIPAEDVLSMMVDLTTLVVSALEGLPGRLAPRLADMGEAGAIEDGLRTEIFDVRTRLETAARSMAADIPDDLPDPAPEPEKDLFSMGGSAEGAA